LKPILIVVSSLLCRGPFDPVLGRTYGPEYIEWASRVLRGEKKMTSKEILGIQETEEGRKIEISFRRVVGWTLVFTNAFFVSYFFAKLFRWI